MSEWPIRKRLVLLISFLLVGSFFEPSPAQTTKPEAGKDRARSVVFYLIDTCRNDRMEHSGYDRATTPFLEWLAERSVVFEACYSQAPWTKPSMASLLCSQYPSATGVQQMTERLPEKFVTWPEVLQANGLYTAGFSANIVMGNLLSNFAQGFDHFVESTMINQGDPIRFASGSAKKINDHVFRWLDATEYWPMLLYLHSVDPHEEYEPEAEYLEAFANPERDPRYRQEWQELLKSRPPIPGLYVTRENFDRTGIDAASFIAHGSDLYDGDLRANDDQIERLWKRLETDGWGDDMIFVVTSDHGEEFFDHGGTCHGYSLYDELLRVPLMIYAPGLLPAGKRIETPVRSLDIYPTLCDLLGIEPPEGLEGVSLVPLIEGEPDAVAQAAERPILAEHREDPVVRQMGQGSGVLVSVREGRWKFILNRTSTQFFERPRFELYDLVADPREQKNVADRHPDVVERLEKRVLDFVADHHGEDEVAAWRSGAASKKGTARSTDDLDPRVRAQLRALGYIGGDEDDEAVESEVEPAGAASARPRSETPEASEDRKSPDPAATKRLFEAIRRQDRAAVERAIEEGASLKEWDPATGFTPLTVAALTGDAALVRSLLGYGAKPYKRNRDMSTTLHGVVVADQLSLIQLLVDHGADVDARDTNGATPLHAAAFLGRARATKALLAAGADATMGDVRGSTALDNTKADWPTTQFIFGMLGLELDRARLEAGRAEAAEILRMAR